MATEVDMSDTPDRDEPVRRQSGGSRRIIPTGEQLGPPAPDLTVSVAFEPLPDEPTMSTDDAVRILLQRFSLKVRPRWRQTNFDNSAADDELWELLASIVRMVPETHRTLSVLSNVDLRPILDEIAITKDQELATPERQVLRGQPLTPRQRILANEILQQENANAEEAAHLLLANQDLTPEQYEQQVAQIAYGYLDDPTMALSPPSVVAVTRGEGESLGTAAQQRSALETFEQQQAAIKGTGSPGRASYTNQDIVNMFQTGLVDWQTVIRNEREKIELRRQGFTGIEPDLMIETGGLLITGAPDPALGGPQIPQRAEQIRMLDVYRALWSNDRTAKEIENLQQKLVAAGYLKDDDIRWRGRATDPSTQEAWRQLVSDSFANGRNLSEMLVDQTIAERERQEEESKKPMTDIVLTSQAGIRQLSDQLGRSVIGRHLREEDHARLVEFIHSLERTAQNTLAGEGAQEVQAVDVEAEIGQWIEQEYAQDAAGYDLLGQINSFNDIIRGGR